MYKTFSPIGEKLSFLTARLAEKFLALGGVIYLEIVADFPRLRAFIIKDSSTGTFFAKTDAGVHKLRYRETDGMLLAGIGGTSEQIAMRSKEKDSNDEEFIIKDAGA